MRLCTCILVLKDGSILLGMKKRDFGKGKWNGFGGKVEADESVTAGACRELQEEVHLLANESDLHKIGEVGFKFIDAPEYDQLVHFYTLNKFEGEPTETDEMRPQWFSLDNIPYDDMWSADKHIFAPMLKGDYVEGTVYFTGKGVFDRVELKQPEEIVIQ